MTYIFFLMASLVSFFSGDSDQATVDKSDNTEKQAAFYHS